MESGQMLRRARRRAQLSQRRLSSRTSISHVTIARIESGKEDPRTGTLARLLEECGEELRAVAKRGLGVDRTMIRELLQLTMPDRLEQLRQEAAALEVLDEAARTRRAL